MTDTLAASRLRGAPGGPGDFAVPSASMPGETWTVTWVAPGLYWCPCPPFQRRQRCRHTERAALAVAAEARALVAASTPESRAAAAEKLRALEEIFGR